MNLENKMKKADSVKSISRVELRKVQTLTFPSCLVVLVEILTPVQVVNSISKRLHKSKELD